jgi:hypothetical protein
MRRAAATRASLKLRSIRPCLIVVVLWVGCGAKTGLDGPPACAAATECPPLDDFCAASVLCTAGACALGPAPDCADETVCTDDVCDAGLASCVHPIRDRDDDTYADGSCGGPDCDDGDASVHPGARERCTGGRDEDCDGAFDCSDLDCEADPACVGCDPEQCESGADEDCDGLVDCDDTDCVCCTAREERCADARDDDCDGDVDCLDADCAAVPTCCLATPETCNGRDDDCDGIADDGVTCFFLDGEPIDPITTTACGRDWYTYDSPDTASAHPVPDLRASGRVAVAIVASPASCGGASVAVIADQVRDGSGGTLRGFFGVDRAGIGGILVSDDPPECTWTATGGGCSWRWEPCCTDGALIGPLGDEFCVSVFLTGASGVESVVVFDGPSRTVPRTFDLGFALCGSTIPPR